MQDNCKSFLFPFPVKSFSFVYHVVYMNPLHVQYVHPCTMKPLLYFSVLYMCIAHVNFHFMLRSCMFYLYLLTIRSLKLLNTLFY